MILGIYEKAINNKFDWEQKIVIAKNAGFDFIEVSIDESDEKLARLTMSDNEILHLNELLIKYNFKFNSMCLSGHRRFPFGSHDPVIRERAKLIIKQAIILAKKLHINIIQLAGYDVYYEKSDAETIRYFIEGIKVATKLASKHCIMLAFEVMDTKFMGTIELVKKYCELVGSPWLQIYPDVGNLSQFSNNPSQEILDNKNRIVAFHLKDTKPNTFKCVPWGQGDVDFITILKAINKISYTGPFLLEMWSENNKSETIEENIETIRKAKDFISEKFKGANWNVR